jgi:hypothetical protein
MLLPGRVNAGIWDYTTCQLVTILTATAEKKIMTDSLLLLAILNHSI